MNGDDDDDDGEANVGTMSNYSDFCTGRNAKGFAPKLLLYLRYFLEDDQSRWNTFTRELMENAQSTSSIGTKGAAKSASHKTTKRTSDNKKKGGKGSSTPHIVQHEFLESTAEKRKFEAEVQLVQTQERGELLKQIIQLTALIKEDCDDDGFFASQLADLKGQVKQLSSKRCRVDDH